MESWKKTAIIGGILGFFIVCVIDYFAISVIGNQIYFDIYLTSIQLSRSSVLITAIGIPIIFGVIGTLLIHKFYSN